MIFILVIKDYCQFKKRDNNSYMMLLPLQGWHLFATASVIETRQIESEEKRDMMRGKNTVQYAVFL